MAQGALIADSFNMLHAAVSMCDAPKLRETCSLHLRTCAHFSQLCEVLVGQDVLPGAVIPQDLQHSAPGKMAAKAATCDQ